MEKAERGGKIKLGGYDWLVLDIFDRKALVVSDRILSERAYHSAEEAVTWESSEMRRYLNGDFLGAFSESEKKRIAETVLMNGDNPEYNTAGGNNTSDKVFLLSLGDAEKYFIDNSARTAVKLDGEAMHYWLRSPGCEPTSAAYVEYDGVISYGYGHWSGVLSIGGVRPAMLLHI